MTGFRQYGTPGSEQQVPCLRQSYHVIHELEEGPMDITGLIPSLHIQKLIAPQSWRDPTVSLAPRLQLHSPAEISRQNHMHGR